MDKSISCIVQLTIKIVLAVGYFWLLFELLSGTNRAGNKHAHATFLLSSLWKVICKVVLLIFGWLIKLLFRIAPAYNNVDIYFYYYTNVCNGHSFSNWAKGMFLSYQLCEFSVIQTQVIQAPRLSKCRNFLKYLGFYQSVLLEYLDRIPAHKLRIFGFMNHFTYLNNFALL